jgi:hypothetical protein
MGMQAAKSAEASLSHAHSFKVREDNAASVSHDYVFDVAFSVYKDAYLAINLMRQFSQLPRELLSDDLPRRDAPLVELVEALNLIRLQSLNVSFDAANNSSSSSLTAGNILHQEGEMRISKCEMRNSDSEIHNSLFEICISHFAFPFPLAKGGGLG